MDNEYYDGYIKALENLEEELNEYECGRNLAMHQIIREIPSLHPERIPYWKLLAIIDRLKGEVNETNKGDE